MASNRAIEPPLYSFVVDQPCPLCGSDQRWRTVSCGNEPVWVGYDGTVRALGCDSAPLYLAVTDPVFWC